MLDEFIKNAPEQISNLLKFYLNSLNSYDLERLLDMYNYEKKASYREEYDEIIDYLEKILQTRKEQ